MRIKFIILFSFILWFFTACKSKKEIQTPEVDSSKEKVSMYWKQIDMQLSNSQFESHDDYITYELDETTFQAALKNKLVEIPDLNGAYNSFKVSTNTTISPELAERFPELLTYTGVQQNNKACQARITTHNEKIDITVLCNDKTYYIKNFQNQTQSIYVLYDKQSLTNTQEIHD